MVQEAEQDREKRRWEEWIPDLQEQLRDRMFSILGDRFKIEYIAEQLSNAGATRPRDVLAFIHQHQSQAQMAYPKWAPLDALYKAMRDGILRPSV